MKDVLGSLAVRLVALLSLALMPIGAIAVFQTSQLSEQLLTEARAALLARTSSSIEFERSIVERAFGAAELLALSTADYREDRASCYETMRRTVAGDSRYSFAGIVESDMGIPCSSAGSPIAVSDPVGISRIYAEGIPAAAAYANPPQSGQAVLAVFQPVYLDQVLSHFVLVSIPQTEVSPFLRSGGFENARSVLVFNRAGEVLKSDLTEEQIRVGVPEGVALDTLAKGVGTVFRGTISGGEPRVFSVVPIYRGVVYAIASWTPASVGLPEAGMRITPWLFPIVMWLATLVVTYFALSRLVVRHIRDLRIRMRIFARTRRFDEIPNAYEQPVEFQDMNRSFQTMAEAILHDEAELENTLREKNLLLREVHHRVKNNLQLIASIMNMQARKAQSTETAQTVRRLQDRVLGLAAIYRRMYESDSMSAMPIKEVLEDLLSQALLLAPSSDVRHDIRFENLRLMPDQAVPLALLAAETAANAIRHLGTTGTEKPWIEATLRQTGDDFVQFEMRNSVGAVPVGPDGLDQGSQGLGTQLVRAFVSQLRGTMEMSVEDGAYSVSVNFQREMPTPEQSEILAGGDVQTDT